MRYHIAGTARYALNAARLGRQPYTTLASPSDPAAWIAHHQRVIRDILGNDRAGADKRKFANHMSTDDCGICADGGPPFH